MGLVYGLQYLDLLLEGAVIAICCIDGTLATDSRCENACSRLAVTSSHCDGVDSKCVTVTPVKTRFLGTTAVTSCRNAL